MFKICLSCNRKKRLKDFGFDIDEPSGYKRFCLSCVSNNGELSMNVHDRVILGGEETTVTGKVAAGKYFRYTFADGRDFWGDPEELKKKGQLEVLPKAKSEPTFTRPEPKPNFDRAPMPFDEDESDDDEQGELVGT